MRLCRHCHDRYVCTGTKPKHCSERGCDNYNPRPQKPLRRGGLKGIAGA